MDLDCGPGARRRVPAAPLTFERRAWCEDAELGLADTFGRDRDELVAGVRGGWLELWRINDGASWAITRAQAGVLTVCCYQGRDVKGGARAFAAIAKRNGL